MGHDHMCVCATAFIGFGLPGPLLQVGVQVCWRLRAILGCTGASSGWGVGHILLFTKFTLLPFTQTPGVLSQ